MKKCYIAGKIGDLPEFEYKANFERAKKEVTLLGYVPVSPVDLPHQHGRTWSDYMREDIKALMDCEALFALKNWRNSTGARIEVETATSIGIHVIHQQ